MDLAFEQVRYVIYVLMEPLRPLTDLVHPLCGLQVADTLWDLAQLVPTCQRKLQ